MKNTFTTLIYRGEKFYVAECLELGVVSQGKTPVEAKDNLKEAVELYLEEEPVEIQSVKGPKLGALRVAT